MQKCYQLMVARKEYVGGNFASVINSSTWQEQNVVQISHGWALEIGSFKGNITVRKYVVFHCLEQLTFAKL